MNDIPSLGDITEALKAENAALPPLEALAPAPPAGPQLTFVAMKPAEDTPPEAVCPRCVLVGMAHPGQDQMQSILRLIFPGTEATALAIRDALQVPQMRVEVTAGW